MRFLDGVDEASCMGYLQHIVDDLGETRAEFHDRLAELYLKRINDEGRSKGSARADQSDGKSRLLAFLNRSDHYRPYRLLQKLQEGPSYGLSAIFR